jgi:ribosomal protein L37AE/L43A
MILEISSPEAIENVIEALRKQTPMLVKHDGDNHICPACSKLLYTSKRRNKYDDYLNYCPVCGQRLGYDDL